MECLNLPFPRVSVVAAMQQGCWVLGVCLPRVGTEHLKCRRCQQGVHALVSCCPASTFQKTEPYSARTRCSRHLGRTVSPATSSSSLDFPTFEQQHHLEFGKQSSLVSDGEVDRSGEQELGHSQSSPAACGQPQVSAGADGKEHLQLRR